MMLLNNSWCFRTSLFLNNALSLLVSTGERRPFDSRRYLVQQAMQSTGRKWKIILAVETKEDGKEVTFSCFKLTNAHYFFVCGISLLISVLLIVRI